MTVTGPFVKWEVELIFFVFMTLTLNVNCELWPLKGEFAGHFEVPMLIQSCQKGIVFSTRSYNHELCWIPCHVDSQRLCSMLFPIIRGCGQIPFWLCICDWDKEYRRKKKKFVKNLVWEENNKGKILHGGNCSPSVGRVASTKTEYELMHFAFIHLISYLHFVI